MFFNNWRKPWWAVFFVAWVATVTVARSYEIESETAVRIALVVAGVAAGATWGVIRLLWPPPPPSPPSAS